MANDTVVTRCEQCGCELAWYNATLDSAFCSSEYEEDFPGWCHTCLVEHCLQTNCLQCELRKYPKCSFISMKKFYLEENND